MKHYYIKTFGCQMNVYDSERIADILQTLGYREASSPREADLIIFNTCHIREKAAEKVFSDLGRINLIKEERREQGKETTIGVVGCVVQAEDEQIAKRAPFVDFATGPLTYHRIPEILAKVNRKKGIPVIDTEFPAESKFDFLPQNSNSLSCAFLAVQEGCNNFCTYCVVPYTRGAEYSRPVKEVVEEARRLVQNGALEINLLGQNVNSYHGEDTAGKERPLSYLLRELAKIDGLKRLRYTTSYPADMTDDLIECHRDLDKLMPYLHLPVQSGSDKILKAMNRRHTSSDYLKVIEKLHKANPDIGMSSDFIVGFPGETEEEHMSTLKFLEKCHFSAVHVFPYSRRPGTKAADMPEQVPNGEKHRRCHEIQELANRMGDSFRRQQVGKKLSVLFETFHDGLWHGHTENYLETAEPGEDLRGKILPVQITGYNGNILCGEVTTHTV